jgi:hypothetical protein
LVVVRTTRLVVGRTPFNARYLRTKAEAMGHLIPLDPADAVPAATAPADADPAPAGTSPAGTSPAGTPPVATAPGATAQP